MKYLILTLVLVVVTSFTSGHYKDSLDISDSVQIMAMDKTDHQIDSIFIKPITFKQLDEGFEGIVNHMDSLNAASIILLKQRDSLASLRDDAILLAIRMQERNTALRKENTRYSKTLSLMQSLPHILMVLCTTIFGYLIAIGLLSGYKKWKNEG